MDLKAVTDAVAAVEEANSALYWAVVDARQFCTWQEVADALGISRQAAQQRFASDVTPLP